MEERSLAFRVGVVALSALALSCGAMREDVRVERGPVLRSYSRQRDTGEHRVVARVDATAARVQWTFQDLERCVEEQIEESAEERVTEYTPSGMGASLALGITGSLAGGLLLLARPALPNTPAVGPLGQPGPSPRETATFVGVVGLAAGIPALGVGLYQASRAGERVERGTSSQVVESRDVACHPRPVDGEVVVSTARGDRVLHTRAGQLELPSDAPELAGDFVLALDGKPVDPDDAGTEALDRVRACALLSSGGWASAPMPPLSPAEARRRLAVVRECALLPGSDVAALEATLSGLAKAGADGP